MVGQSVNTKATNSIATRIAMTGVTILEDAVVPAIGSIRTVMKTAMSLAVVIIVVTAPAP